MTTDEQSSQDLLVALVAGVHNETLRISNSCAESKALVAFNDGFAAGFAAGQRAAKSDIQQALGFDVPSVYEWREHELARKAWEVQHDKH